jgi:hypothetical protein
MVLPQRINLENLLAFCCQTPVGKELVFMNFDPRMYELELCRRKRSCKDAPFGDRNNCFFVTILDVNMGHLVLLIVEVIH